MAKLFPFGRKGNFDLFLHIDAKPAGVRGPEKGTETLNESSQDGARELTAKLHWPGSPVSLLLLFRRFVPMVKQDRAPQLWPMGLVLAALFWLITTTGGRHVFVQDMLGAAYDSQAEHLLHGDPGVSGDAIRHEVMIVNGKSRMYFGPFPAFLRIPLNYVYPQGSGHWSRISGFCAGIVALASFSALVRRTLRVSDLSRRWRNWLGNICLVGFALASPFFLLLADVSIYHEAIIWGLAWSLAALYFAGRCRRREGASLTLSLVAFAVCAGAAILSRVTFGLPLLLIAPLLAAGLLRQRHQVRNLTALLLPLGAAVLFHLALNYAKFGDFVGAGIQYHVNPVQREFARQHGLFRLERVPYSLADYFILRRPIPQPQAPFLKTSQQSYDYPDLYVMPFTETYSSLIWCSSWIVLGALIGIRLLVKPACSDGLDRAIALVLFGQIIIVSSFMGLAQRYIAEFFPFLVFCFVVFLRSGSVVFRARYLVIFFVTVSVMINTLATLSWLVDVDANTPADVRASWKAFLQRKPDS